VPEISSALSRKTGWKVSRVSMNPRNPALATPDAWEQRVLLDFDKRVAKGEKPEAMEYAELVSENQRRFFRFMKPLAMQGVCMGCHGPSEHLTDAMKAQLALEYPHDTAVNYQLGQIRGAVTVKRPLD
jgi:hypothetical protein